MNNVSIIRAPGPHRIFMILNAKEVKQLVGILSTAKVVNAQSIEESLMEKVHTAAGLMEIPY